MEEQHPAMHAVLVACSRMFGPSVEMILGPSRESRIVMARHVAMYVLCKSDRWTQAEVARFMRRDHASVIHGVERIETRLKRTGRNTAELMTNTENLIRICKRELTQTELVTFKGHDPGFTRIIYIPEYRLELTQAELDWLTNNLARGDIVSQVADGYLLNIHVIKDHWTRGLIAAGGSERMAALITRYAANYEYLWVLPKVKEKSVGSKGR